MNATNPIVGVDLRPPAQIQISQPNFTYRQADATDLSQFADGEFDVAISTGLLEHIQPRERLVQAVREHRRVARRYAVVTTHRFAFIEPHFRLPLFSMWPDRLKRLAVGRFHPAGTDLLPDGSTRAINWLSGEEWLRLFDDPTAATYDHWYGPCLLFQLIVGGEGRPGRPPDRYQPT
jgi:Methyltransferase domain